MRKIITLALVTFISSVSFATTTGKNSTQFGALGSAWKSYRSIPAKQDKNDLEMVYGGEDVIRSPLNANLATA